MPDNEQIDLNQAYWRRTISERIKESFDNYALSNANGDGYRDHLGASIIGHECTRYLWYHFRWFRREVHSARMYSLFDQGHRIEKQIRETLESCGATFWYPNPNDHEIQRFSDINGHFGGSIDGVFTWPAIGLKDWYILECKSSKTGSTFAKLFTDEVSGAQPRHYAQQSVYGLKFQIRNALYVAYNKNDSTIYYEIVDLDWMLGEELTKRADFVIHSQEPPAKIKGASPNFFICKMCAFWGICHVGDKPVANCRNCIHSRPIENGEWACLHWNALIPKETIPKGCAEHVSLPY
jgi:hypothetical protein